MRESDAAHLTEEGDPSQNLRAFRRALGQFATGVTIITACVGDRLAGVTANSFTSVSLDPPLVLWSLESKAQSLPVFREASHFAVNVLAADQVDLSTRFSRSVADKFSSVDWSMGRNGAPLIFRAYEHLSAAFEQHREAEGLTINQSRVLACLAANPGSSIEALSRLSYVGFQTTEDAISVLLAAGFAAMRPPAAIDITALGRSRLAGIVARARSFEAERLARIPAADAAALRRALAALGKDG